MTFLIYGAGDEARTRYLHLGKVALYRMSYARINICYYTRIAGKVKHYFYIFLNFLLLLKFMIKYSIVRLIFEV